jgi:hypothetical protein
LYATHRKPEKISGFPHFGSLKEGNACYQVSILHFSLLLAPIYNTFLQRFAVFC